MNIFEMNYYLFITIYLHSELINLIIVSNENFRFGKNRVIFLCVSGYTFYRSWNQKTALFNILNIFRQLIYVFQVYSMFSFTACSVLDVVFFFLNCFYKAKTCSSRYKWVQERGMLCFKKYFQHILYTIQT